MMSNELPVVRSADEPLHVRLTQTRKQRGLSGAELATLFGLSRQITGRWERGTRPIPPYWTEPLERWIETSEPPTTRPTPPPTVASTDRSSLGLRVRLAREKLGLTQSELANLLGVASYKTIAKLEKKDSICEQYRLLAEQWLATVEQSSAQPMLPDKPLNVRLHETRLLKRITARKLAQLFGITEDTLCAWEHGPSHLNGWPIPREWIPLVERWIATGVGPSKEETKLARQQLVVIGAPEPVEPPAVRPTKPVCRRSPEMSWSGFRRIFEQEATLDHAERSREKYSCVLDCFERVIKPKKLKMLNERNLARYAKQLRDFGRLPTTINSHFRVLRRLLMWAFHQRIIAEEPRVQMLRTPKKLPHIVSEEEFQKLLTAAPDHHWTAFFLTALYTGCRLGELCALTWQDVDFANHRILLRAEVNKARRDEWIPMYPGLVPVLEMLDRGSEKVFDLGRSARPAICARVREIATKARVKCKMHDLRRSCASWLAAKGVPLQIVQRLLRHSDPRVTAAFYTNVEGALHDAIAKLPAAPIEQAGFKSNGGGKAVPA